MALQLGGSAIRCSKNSMGKFYTALPYVLIVVQAICASTSARQYVIHRPLASKWSLSLLAALPIPALLAGFATFAFFDVLGGDPARCDVEGCASNRAAFTTLILSAVALYLFGFVTALLGYFSGKNALEGRPSR